MKLNFLELSAGDRRLYIDQAASQRRVVFLAVRGQIMNSPNLEPFCLILNIESISLAA